MDALERQALLDWIDYGEYLAGIAPQRRSARRYFQAPHRPIWPLFREEAKELGLYA